MSAFEFLDITGLEIGGMLVLALVLTLALTVLALGIAWVWRRWKG